MAEINKLSVGKVLDKLRSNNAPKKSKIMQLVERIARTERLSLCTVKRISRGIRKSESD